VQSDRAVPRSVNIRAYNKVRNVEKNVTLFWRCNKKRCHNQRWQDYVQVNAFEVDCGKLCLGRELTTNRPVQSTVRQRLAEKPPCIYTVGQKRGHILMTIILSNLKRFKKFFTGRFFNKFAIKRILEIWPNLAYVTTLPCETFLSAKQANNDKVQGSVATYLTFGGVVNNQIKKCVLLSLRLKKLISVNIWKSYKQERDCLVHFLHLIAVCWPSAQSAWDNHALACNFAKYSPVKTFFHSHTQQ